MITRGKFICSKVATHASLSNVTYVGCRIDLSHVETFRQYTSYDRTNDNIAIHYIIFDCVGRAVYKWRYPDAKSRDDEYEKLSKLLDINIEDL